MVTSPSHPGRVCVNFTPLSEDSSYRTAASHGDLFNNHASKRTIEFDFRSKWPALHRKLEATPTLN